MTQAVEAKKRAPGPDDEACCGLPVVAREGPRIPRPLATALQTRDIGLFVDVARHQRQRGQIKAKRLFHHALVVAAAIALAVRAVAPKQQAGLQQQRQVPAQRRRRHAARAN